MTTLASLSQMSLATPTPILLPSTGSAPSSSVASPASSASPDGALDHPASAEKIRDACLHALDENKGEDIVVLDVRDRCGFCDYMIFVSGASSRKVAALTREVVDVLGRSFKMRPSVEGLQAADWVVVDAFDVVVYLFRPEVRAYYDLESTWTFSPPAPSDLAPSDDLPLSTT